MQVERQEMAASSILCGERRQVREVNRIVLKL
jgi:hypothetical protein